MRVTTFVLAIGLACASSPAWAMQQEGGQRYAEGLKPIGRLAEHIFPLSKVVQPERYQYEQIAVRIRRMSRAELAEGIWVDLREYYEQVLRASLTNYEYKKAAAEKSGRVEEFHRLHRKTKNPYAIEYWRFELLIRELTPEIIYTGVTQEEIDESIVLIRSLFASLNVELYLPNAAYFPDVPEDHWAEPAIHNMRRAGVLYGYPDGKYRM